MCTKEEVKARVDAAAAKELFFKHAILSGSYEAHYQNAYNHYIDLAVAVKALKEKVYQLPIGHDVRTAIFCSVDIHLAIAHLDRIEKQNHEQAIS